MRCGAYKDLREGRDVENDFCEKVDYFMAVERRKESRGWS